MAVALPPPTRKRRALYPNREKRCYAGERAAPPQHCQCVFRELRNLAKDAHRGRHGTSCPAMPPLRFLWGLTPPHGCGPATTPAKAQGALPQLGKWEKRRLRRSTARKVYRKDAKGGAAHSVRDRLTAPLAKPLRLWGQNGSGPSHHRPHTAIVYQLPI